MTILQLPLLKKKFQELFNSDCRVFQSPGRVNIIGEHTDYNNGFVLPAAINKASYVAIQKRSDDSLVLYSTLYDAMVETRLETLAPMEELWPNYILGVVNELHQRGLQLSGFNLLLAGDVPLGAGVSSSASVECAVAFALNAIFDLRFTPLELVYISQKAEHNFAGVHCGIMDQFASTFGKKDHCIKLDCRTLHYEYIPLELNNYKLVLLNTNVKHSLASTAYNTRRQQCETGVQLVKEHVPEVESLRDISMDLLNKYVKPLNEEVYIKCRYVVQENERLLNATDALQQGDLKKLGACMYATHEGLSREYEVSCPELDYLVNYVRNNPAVAGARMMGGGFGGCTINLVEDHAIEYLVNQVSADYEKSMGLPLTYYVIETADGSSEVID